MNRRVRVQGDLFHGRVPDGAVYIGRAAPGLKASPYANPYSLKRYTLDESRRRYRALLPSLVDQARADIGDANVACWCHDDAPWCHGDDLLAAIAGTAPASETDTPAALSTTTGSEATA